MNKLNLAVKIAGLITVVLVFAGLFNMALFPVLQPFILTALAATLILYAVSMFINKNIAGMVTIFMVLLFIAAIKIFG